MSCSGARRVDAPIKRFGSAGLSPAGLARDASYFHNGPRRSLSTSDRARCGRFRLSWKTVRGRGSGKGHSQGSRRLASTAPAACPKQTDLHGASLICEVLRLKFRAVENDRERFGVAISVYLLRTWNHSTRVRGRVVRQRTISDGQCEKGWNRTIPREGAKSGALNARTANS